MRASNDSANLTIIHAVTGNGDISLVQCRRGFYCLSYSGKIIVHQEISRLGASMNNA